MKPFASGSRVPLLLTVAHFFPEGQKYLDSHFLVNERSRMAQGETPLLPAVVGPHNIRRQHFLMLWWVLLCDYCSSFYHLPNISEPGRAINAHIIVAAYHCNHCLLFRVYSFTELSSAFIITTPEGAVVVYTNTSVIFFQSYITRAWVMPASFVQSCILLPTLWKVGFYWFLSSPKDFSTRSHYCSLLQQHSQ
jgi:hypothetical protein